MTVWQLVYKEIYRRKLNFISGLLSIIIAIAALIAAATSLSIHDSETQKIIAAKKLETERRMKDLENDYRIIMKKLGFNLLILPEGQISLISMLMILLQNICRKIMSTFWQNQK